MALVARLLGRTDFGALGMIQSTIGIFSILAGVGIGSTAVKHVAELRSSDPDRAGRIIGLLGLCAIVSGGIMAGLAFCLSPYFAGRLLNAPRLAPLLRIGSGLLLVNAVAGVQTGVLAGLEAFRAIAWVHLVRGVLSFPLMVAGTWYFGLPGATGALVATALVGCAVGWVAVANERRKCHIRVDYRRCCREVGILWSFSLPAFLCAALVNPVLWGVRALLVNQPDGYAQMGLFSACLVFRRLISLTGSTVGAVFLPMLSSAEAAGNERFQRSNIVASWLIGAVPSVAIIAFPEVLAVFFGDRYYGRTARTTLILVMVYTSISLYKQGLARILYARGLLWWGFLSNATWAAILLACGFHLVRWGSVGLAMSLLIAYGVNTVVFLPLYARKGLAARRSLVSTDALLVWLVVAGIALLSVCEAHAGLRAAALAGGLGLIGCALLRLLLHSPAEGRQAPPGES